MKATVLRLSAMAILIILWFVFSGNVDISTKFLVPIVIVGIFTIIGYSMKRKKA